MALPFSRLATSQNRSHKLYSILPSGKYPARQKPRQSAFTLVEVILAIGIAIGLLVVALHFYQQAANLRAQILQESERISVIRLLTDRLTRDLRAARAHKSHDFTGDSTSLRFVKPDVFSFSAWDRGQSQTDLKLVTFSATTGREGTNLIVTGVTRSEQQLIEPRPLTAARAAESATATNTVAEPLTDAIRYVRFRYWDGTNWVESWDAAAPPRAVEVSFGADPMPENAVAEEYPFELFRRVILLPGGRASDKNDILARRETGAQADAHSQ